jgi:AraC-like DNA-binding protein
MAGHLAKPLHQFMLVNSPTLAASFVQNMLSGASRVVSSDEMTALVLRAGIPPALLAQRAGRVTREQFVQLYELIALTSGDEMLGLWSRPIRAGTLKYLGLSLLDAPSLMVAMYRFTRFWNLLLDDYSLVTTRKDKVVTLSLKPLDSTTVPTIFGHELMVKLIHGMASWLAGRKLPIGQVGVCFSRPAHFSDYALLFPGPVCFGQTVTSITFSENVLRQPFQRSKAELIRFVKRAPDDWIFVTFEHGQCSDGLRRLLARTTEINPTLDFAANALFMSGRSLSRKLSDEGTSFQKIKDEWRRDSAIERLVKTRDPIDHIAALIGFDNTPAFHRAFKGWTGSTPGTYRRKVG